MPRPKRAGIHAYLRTALLAVFTLSCGPGSGVVRQDQQPGLDVALRSAARTIAQGLEPGSRIVVLNLTPFGSDRTLTMLGVYLARRLSSELQRTVKTGVTVLDRGSGEKAWVEEMRFSVKLTDPAELLSRFEADVALVGEYRLRAEGCVLELVGLKAVGTGSAEVIADAACVVRGEYGDYAEWKQLHEQPPPGVTRKMLDFVSSSGEMDAVDYVRVRKESGQLVQENGEIRVGDRMKIELGISKLCYVYVIGWDHTNRYFSVLFPHEGEKPQVDPGSLSLPPGNKWAEALAPAGYNWVKVITTSNDIGVRGVGEGFIQDGAAQDRIVDRILELGPSSWGSRSFAVNIVER